MREECSWSSLTSKRFSHQGKRGVPRTYLRRKVLKGIEGPSLENRMSIEGSHSGGNEKNREPKRLSMGCSGSQRGLKERKRELFAGGTSAQSKKIRGRGMIPDFPGSPYSTDSPYSLPRFAVSPGCRQSSQASGGSHKRAGSLTGVRRISPAVAGHF